MPPRVAGLTGATLQTAPSVCHECVWWQSRTRGVDKRRWIAKAEEEWGAWGRSTTTSDGRLLGSMQYGPAGLFPRAGQLLPVRRHPTPCSSRARTWSTRRLRG
jgi:hypothetical protein